MVPMDAIWLILGKTQPLSATSWVPARPPPSHPVGVLVVMARLVKNSNMARNLASYALNSWWIDVL